VIRTKTGRFGFWPGTSAGTTVRNCTVPAGKALFFPIVNYFYGFLPGDEVDVAGARAYIKEQIDTASNLACEIDGDPVANLSAYREQSDIFGFVITQDNIYYPSLGGLNAYPVVDDGIYLMVAPLKAGQHTIHIHGCLNNCAFELDVTDHLTVQ